MGLGMILDMAAADFPDRLALGRTADGTSYAQLLRAAAAGAELVRESGAQHVVFLGTNSEALPVATFAAAGARRPLVPLNYRLTGDMIRELAGRVEAPLVIADAAFAHHFEGTGRQVVTTEDFLARVLPGSDAPLEEGDDEEVAVILFTSGTTSAPKGVLLKHHHLVSYILQTVEFGGAAATDAALVSTPPYHIAGLGAVLSNVYSGRRMVYLEDFTPEVWLTTVREECVSTAMVVPTMLARIVEHLGEEDAATPALSNLSYGGSRMPLPVLERALRAFPDTGFVNAYGLTETSSTIAVLGPEDHRSALADPMLRHRLGSTGRLVPGMEAEIRDEAGAVLPEGQVGLLWVRGAQVSGEYLEQGSALDEGGWFPTKDQARMEDGYLYIGGRADDTIIRGGENIAPAEIEDVLAEHPGVLEVAVVGLPDDEWGERTVAAVVLRPGLEIDPEELRGWSRQRLRGSRTPDQVVFVEELPRTPTGKLVRRTLVGNLAPATP